MKKYLLKTSFALLVGCSVLSFSSCQSLGGIRDRLDKLEISVRDLQSAVKVLQDAYRDGKIIKSVTPLTDAEAGGWLLTFSDMSEIRIENGVDGINGIDGITPIMKIDQDGYWSVSYDNGETFTALLDENEQKINAVGIDGTDGVDGTEGISIRVDVNKSGYYVVQTYRESDPDTVIKEIVTPYSSTASHVISSMTQDDLNHSITMKMANGSTFTFAQHYEFPTSITIMTTGPVLLSKAGQSSVEFRVSPSNASLGTTSNCKIELDVVGTYNTRASYVTAPTYYRLLKVEQVYDSKNGVLKTGHYKATISDSNTAQPYDEMAAIVLTLTDSNSSQFQVSSSSFEVKSTY